MNVDQVCSWLQGALYASAAAPRSPSMLTYRPFQTWAGSGEWTLPLPALASAMCVAAGGSFCAVATSDRVLRTFALSGARLGALSPC